MTKQEVIEQLESLMDNSKSFIREKEDDEFNDIWKRDIQALEKAIKILEVTPLE